MAKVECEILGGSVSAEDNYTVCLEVCPSKEQGGYNHSQRAYVEGFPQELQEQLNQAFWKAWNVQSEEDVMNDGVATCEFTGRHLIIEHDGFEQTATYMKLTNPRFVGLLPEAV